MDVFGKKITFLNSNHICSVKDLDIHAALGLFGDKITFVIGNKIRSVNNFDVTATLGIAKNIAKMMGVGKVAQTIKIELKSKPSYAQVYGKLSLNALVDNLDLKMNQAAGDFKLLGTKNNLMLEYKNKEDGKLFSLKVKTIQIFENFSKMDGVYAAPIKFSMIESLQNTQLSLSLNIQDQSFRGSSFKMKAGRGAKFIEINGKTKLTGTNKYYLRLQGATEATPKLLDIKGSATYPLEWKSEVTFTQTTKITFEARAAQDLSECIVKFDIIRNARKELTTTLKMVNGENEKLINSEFKYGSNTLKINGNAKMSGTNKYYLRLQGATEAEPKLFDIKGSVTYPREWNLEVTFRQTTKITFVAKATQDHSESNINFAIVRNQGIVYQADWKLSIVDIQKFLLRLTNDHKFLEFVFNNHLKSGNFNLKSNFIDEVIEAVFAYMSKNSLKKFALRLA